MNMIARGWGAASLLMFAMASAACASAGEKADTGEAGDANDSQTPAVTIQPGFEENADEEDEGAEGDEDQSGSNLPRDVFHKGTKAPASCTVKVDTQRELMITDLAVVEDSVRTKWTGSLANASDGAWHFGRLMTNMAGAKNAPEFVERWLHRWEKDRPVNGWNVEARPRMKDVVTDAWPKTKDGHVDLAKAPMRLLAIVNRVDLRNLSKGHAGEGRFVFGVLDRNGNPLEFTVILEYRLPAKTEADVKEWSTLWHELGAQKAGSAAYRTALQKVTDKFTGKNAEPGRPNGSAISQIRTNEIAFAGEWELREFRLSTKTGNIYSATVKQTPDITLDGTSTLGTWINDHEKELLDGTAWVTTTNNKKKFRAGSSLTPPFFSWTPKGVKNSEARHLFSLNTCNGCHAGETQTAFLHVGVRSKGQTAPLSGFLTGQTVPDPVSGENRTFADLDRRNDDFRSLLCAK